MSNTSDKFESGSSLSPPPYGRQGDEIDLRELWKVIWQGKGIVVALTLVTSVVAISYALMAQELWNSRAIIVAPSMKQMERHRQQVKRLYPAFYVGLERQGNLFLDGLIDNDRILFRYVSAYNSLSNKKAFFDSNEIFKQIKKEAMEAGENNLEKLYYEWYDRITANPKYDKYSKTVLLSAQGTTRGNSLRILEGYVEFVNNVISREIKEELAVIVKSQQEELTQIKNSLKRQVQQQLSSELDNPKFLQAKIYEVESKLYILEQTKIDNGIISCFRFAAEPMSLSRPSEPNKVLIVLLGFFLGGVIGSGIVFIRFVLKK